MSDTVNQLRALLHDQPQNPMRPEQVRLMTEERDRCQGIANMPAWVAGANRGQAIKDAKRIDKQLREQAAKPIEEGHRRDKIAKLTVDLIGEVKEAMLPRSVMRRNPAGAVDQFLRKENSRAVKDKILTAKRAMRALEPDNDEPNYTNFERFRNEGAGPDGTATFMAEAQIPGKFAMSITAKENWPLGEPTATTAIGQVKAAEAAVNTPAKHRKVPVLTEEQKQARSEALAKARSVAAAKRAAQSQVTQDVPASQEV